MKIWEEVKELEERHVKGLDRRDELEDRVVALGVTIATLEGDNDRLTTEVEGLRKENERLQALVAATDDAGDILRDTEDDVDFLYEEMSRLTATIKTVRGELKDRVLEMDTEIVAKAEAEGVEIEITEERKAA